MKNIHILPTDKPSRLALQLDCKPNYNLQLSKISDDWTKNWQKQNIYITNDEEIKEGDWVIYKEDNSIIKMKTKLSVMLGHSFKTHKKIILTTDQDLIKDGVQAIDDEFLEWFVKNPSCEEVEVEEHLIDTWENTLTKYKIIIPSQDALNHFLSTSSVIVKDPQISNFNKQETLEEVAERLYPNRESFLHRFQNIERNAFIEGAKWQMERSYSEEDMEIVEISSIDANYIPHYQTKEGQFLATKFNVKQFKKK